MASEGAPVFSLRTTAADWVPPAAAPASAATGSDLASTAAAPAAAPPAQQVKSKYGGDYTAHASAGTAAEASVAAASHSWSNYLDVLASAPPILPGSLTHSSSTGLTDGDAANFDEIDEAMRVVEFEAFLDEQGVTDEDERARMIVEYLSSTREAAAAAGGEEEAPEFGDADQTEAALTAESAAAAALTGTHAVAGDGAYYAGDAQSAMALLAGGWPSYVPQPSLDMYTAAAAQLQATYAAPETYSPAPVAAAPKALSAASQPYMPPSAAAPAVTIAPTAAPAPVPVAPAAVRPPAAPAPANRSKYGTGYS